MKNKHEEQTNTEEKGNAFWPFLLIIVGILLLLNNMGIIPWAIWTSLVSLWPLILIFTGLEIMSESSGFAKVIVRAIEIIIIMYIIVYVISLYHSGFNSFLRSKFKWWPKQNKLFFKEYPDFRMRRWTE